MVGISLPTDMTSADIKNVKEIVRSSSRDSGNPHHGGSHLDDKHHCAPQQLCILRALRKKLRCVAFYCGSVESILTDILHHSLVCQHQSRRQKGSPEGHAHCSKKNWIASAHIGGHLQNPQQSQQDFEECNAPHS